MEDLQISWIQCNSYRIFPDSSSDDDSVGNEELADSTPDKERPKDTSTPQMFPPPPLSDTSSTGSPPPINYRARLPPPPNNWDHRIKHEMTEINDVMQNMRPCEFM